MVSLSTLTLLARSAAGRLTGISGDTIAVALATLARGLAKVGDIDIDSTGPSATAVHIRNSTAGQVCTLNVTGNVEAATVGLQLRRRRHSSQQRPVGVESHAPHVCTTTAYVL